MLESDGTKKEREEEDLLGPAVNDEAPAEVNDEAPAEVNDEAPAEVNDEAPAEVNDEAPAEEAAAGDEAVETSGEDVDEALFIDLPDEEYVEETADTADEPAAADAEAGPVSEEDELLDALEIQLTPAEQAEIERRGRMRWYVIHANTGHENKVKRNIEMAIKSNHMEESFGEVMVATQEVTEMKNGKRSVVKRKFFPSYILVEMIMDNETQHFINSIPGVTRFIGGNVQRPQAITRDEVDRILGRISAPDEVRQTLEIPYEVGDNVQVTDGPFTEWTGVINEINHDKGKLKVMISIFGSETPVELDFLQVKPL